VTRPHDPSGEGASARYGEARGRPPPYLVEGVSVTVPAGASRSVLITSIIVALLTGSGLVTLINALSTRDERAQAIEFREFDRLIAEIARQDARLVLQETRIGVLSERIGSMADALLERQGEIRALNTRITELERELLQRDAQIAGLNAEVARLSALLPPGGD
jgi:septal ring factor EnvC (AmiA/AmiB activator)